MKWRQVAVVGTWLACQAACAELSLISAPQDATDHIYLDMASVSQSDGLTQAWISRIYDQLQKPEGGISFRRVRFLVQMNCQTGQTRHLKAEFYASAKGSEAPKVRVGAERLEQAFQAPERGTPEQLAEIALCDNERLRSVPGNLQVLLDKPDGRISIDRDVGVLRTPTGYRVRLVTDAPAPVKPALPAQRISYRSTAEDFDIDCERRTLRWLRLSQYEGPSLTGQLSLMRELDGNQPVPFTPNDGSFIERFAGLLCQQRSAAG